MTRTWQMVAGAALGVALVAGAGLATVAAQGPAGPGGPGAQGRRGPGGLGGGLALPLRGLDLTDTQREQVRTAVAAHKAEFDAVRTRMRTARSALQAAVTAEAFDEAAVRQKSVDVAAVEADAAVLQAKVYSEVWALLTSEQQQKAREL
jgi:Spy/CpxP family protein refolding chaperone